MKIFYSDKVLATVVAHNHTYTLLQADKVPLMQLSETESSMLVVDGLTSVLEYTFDDSYKLLSYTPYGYAPKVNTAPCYLLGYTGQKKDSVTTCYFLGNGYRVFNPALMRFQSPDTLSPFGMGGINMYAYCEDDPVNFQDPSGHVPVFQRRIFNRRQTGSLGLSGANSRISTAGANPVISRENRPAATLTIASYGASRNYGTDTVTGFQRLRGLGTPRPSTRPPIERAAHLPATQHNAAMLPTNTFQGNQDPPPSYDPAWSPPQRQHSQHSQHSQPSYDDASTLPPHYDDVQEASAASAFSLSPKIEMYRKN